MLAPQVRNHDTTLLAWQELGFADLLGCQGTKRLLKLSVLTLNLNKLRPKIGQTEKKVIYGQCPKQLSNQWILY